MKFASILTKLFGKSVNHKNQNIKLRYGFTGASGHRYYYFPDTHYHLNPSRYFDLFLPLQKEYLMKISNNDLDTFIEECEKMKKLEQLQSAIQALKLRRNITLDTKIIYQMMAVVYLRDDEPNTLPSKPLIAEKADDIQKTMSGHGGEADFFQEPELKKFLGSLRLSGANLTLLELHMEEQTRLFEETLSQIRQRTR